MRHDVQIPGVSQRRRGAEEPFMTKQRMAGAIRQLVPFTAHGLKLRD
jgi:hypothetical protein